MRRKDFSEFIDDQGEISLENRIRATFEHGFGWYGDMQALQRAVNRLEKNLDRSFYALTNLPIPGTSTILPMVLLSPQGVRLIIPTAVKGVFRAKGEEWLKIGGGSSRKFTAAKPNLQQRAMNMADDLLNYLREQGFGLPEVEPVLIFTDPRTHVDSLQSKVHVVHADAIDHFAANLQEYQPIMDNDDIREIAQVLTEPPRPEIEEEEPRPVEQKPRPDAPVDLPEIGGEERGLLYAEEAPALTPRQERSLRERRIPLSRRQLILLGAMAIVELFIIGIFAILILANTI
ncbi:MAG: hypothetical protein P1P76_08195 [Anaerolineales bacterium]|nr:hypothetical protein [Anaerolineales bacterium]